MEIRVDASGGPVRAPLEADARDVPVRRSTMPKDDAQEKVTSSAVDKTSPEDVTRQDQPSPGISKEIVDRLVDETRLLDGREMRALFPDCEIHRERFLGLTKSYLAIRSADPMRTVG